MSIFDRTEYYKDFRISGTATAAKNRYIWRVPAIGKHIAFDTLAEAKAAINAVIAEEEAEQRERLRRAMQAVNDVSTVRAPTSRTYGANQEQRKKLLTRSND